MDPQTATASPTQQPMMASATMSGTKKYCYQLSKNVMADVVITGPTINSKDIEMLEKYLELVKLALQDQQTG